MKTTTPKAPPVRVSFIFYLNNGALRHVPEALDPHIERRDGVPYLTYTTSGKQHAEALQNILNLRVNGSARFRLNPPEAVEAPLDLRAFQA